MANAKPVATVATPATEVQAAPAVKLVTEADILAIVNRPQDDVEGTGFDRFINKAAEVSGSGVSILTRLGFAAYNGIGGTMEHVALDAVNIDLRKKDKLRAHARRTAARVNAYNAKLAATA